MVRMPPPPHRRTPTLARKLEKMRAMVAEFAPVEAALPEDVDEVIEPDSLPRDPKIAD